MHRKRRHVLSPLELAMIVIVAVVILVVGPKKIPELARALGGAKRDFDTANSELKKVASGIESAPSMLFSTQAAPPPTEFAAPQSEGDELLVETAQKIGIQTRGKTREQIREEIIKAGQKRSINSGDTTSNPA
jgi:sec-independent protein translocase protein TatA